MQGITDNQDTSEMLSANNLPAVTQILKRYGRAAFVEDISRRNTVPDRVVAGHNRLRDWFISASATCENEILDSPFPIKADSVVNPFRKDR